MVFNEANAQPLAYPPRDGQIQKAGNRDPDHWHVGARGNMLGKPFRNNNPTQDANGSSL